MPHSDWSEEGPIEGQREYVGACRVSLRIDRRAVPWGERFTGVVDLLGGGRDQVIRRLAVSLVQPMANHRHGEPLILGQAQPAGSFQVAAGEVRLVPFSVVAPHAAAFGASTYLDVQIHVPWEFPGGVRESVRVLPPLPYLRVIRLLEELSGYQFVELGLHAGGDGVAAYLAPGPAGTGDADGLCLRWIGEGGFLSGEVVVNLPEQSMMDYAKALVGADRRVFPVRFLLDDLASAREQFSAILNAVRPLPEEVRDLPIPAQRAAPDLDTLPRPITERYRGRTDA